MRIRNILNSTKYFAIKFCYKFKNYKLSAAVNYFLQFSWCVLMCSHELSFYTT